VPLDSSERVWSRRLVQVVRHAETANSANGGHALRVADKTAINGLVAQPPTGSSLSLNAHVHALFPALHETRPGGSRPTWRSCRSCQRRPVLSARDARQATRLLPKAARQRAQVFCLGYWLKSRPYRPPADTVATCHKGKFRTCRLSQPAQRLSTGPTC